MAAGSIAMRKFPPLSTICSPFSSGVSASRRWHFRHEAPDNVCPRNAPHVFSEFN